VIKDMGMPRYFLESEIAHSKHGVVLSQRKYVLDLLYELDYMAASQCIFLWMLILIYKMRLDPYLRTFLSIKDS